MTSFNTYLNSEQCWRELERLVPKKIADLDDEKKKELEGQVTAVLSQVAIDSIKPKDEPHTVIIRKFANKAKKLGILSQEGESVVEKIAKKTRALNLHTNSEWRDITLETRDGSVKVNRDILRKHSKFFRDMPELLGKHDKTFKVDLDAKQMDLFLKLLQKKQINYHTDITDNILENLPAILRCAVQFQCKGFINRLSEVIHKELSKWGYGYIQGYYVIELLPVLQEAKTRSADKLYDVIALEYIIKLGISIPRPRTGLNRPIPMDIKKMRFFFNEKTREFMKQLPFFIDIKNKEELTIFIDACQKHKKEHSLLVLPLKISTHYHLDEAEEKALKTIAKDCNVKCIFVK